MPKQELLYNINKFNSLVEEIILKTILVLSDSHGDLENMKFAVEKTNPDLIIHLGDCWNDAGYLKREYPDIIMERVPGNCDYAGEQEERLLTIEGKKFLLCHGHTFMVKSSLLNIELGAKEMGADVVLFGHTHRVFYDFHNGLVFLNPGSIGAPPMGLPASYGIILIDEETGKFDMDVEYIE